MLDFVPGAGARGDLPGDRQGYYEDEGIDLEIVEPTSTADTLKLIDAGKADFGIADGIDVATQIADGRGAKGIMASTQRPLGGLITLEESGFGTPSGSRGATVGVTGVPSDDAILETTIVRWRRRSGEGREGDDRVQRCAEPRERQGRRVHRVHPGRRRADRGRRVPDHGRSRSTSTAGLSIPVWWCSRPRSRSPTIRS